MVWVQITGPNGKVIANDALIDSGADCSALPVEWMARLGITETQCETREMYGACGSGESHHYRLALSACVEGIHLKLNVAFCEIEVPVLGRNDFFDTFRVTLDQRRKVLTLEPYEDVVRLSQAQAPAERQAPEPEPRS
jgi:hypothetical protein